MVYKIIPGYSSLYKEPLTYEECVNGIPSDFIISIAIAINNSLDENWDDRKNQQFAIGIIEKYFTKDQLQGFVKALNEFLQRSNGSPLSAILSRRYLISWIIKELRRNEVKSVNTLEDNWPLNLYKAYLLIIDEINSIDENAAEYEIPEIKQLLQSDYFFWAYLNKQHQFNERVSVGYEIIKTFTFLHFAFNQYRGALKEYFQKYSFNTVSEWAYLCLTLIDRFHSKSDLFQTSGLDLGYQNNTAFFDDFSINGQGNDKIDLLAIKKKPLYILKNDNIGCIDKDFLVKSIFNKVYFGLYHETELKKHIEFNEYSSIIGKNVFERLFFTQIIKSFKSKGEFVFFDDSTSQCPDAYVRDNNNILLFEFKGNIFRQDIIETSEFEVIKKYIDERFLKNSKKRAKGMFQIMNQLEYIKTGGYDFDELKIELGGYKVYPIICLIDHNFSMPNVNEYLNQIFWQQMGRQDSVSVEPPTLINLLTLLDIAITGHSFSDLATFIDKYQEGCKKSLELFYSTGKAQHLLESKLSFDDIYYSKFHKDENVVEKESELVERLVKSFNLDFSFFETAL